MTTPFIFDDDIGTPHSQEADFFNNIDTLPSAVPDHVRVTRRSNTQDPSVATTFGPDLRVPSARMTLQNNTLWIYMSEESKLDRLVTKALILGDFGLRFRFTHVYMVR